jgi:2-amino-4-hydroxy-6-hydroxymethyldihydropteridine diphosphokinase
MGDTRQTLFRALADIRAIEGISLEKTSRVYDTTALTSAGYDETRPRYANQVVSIYTVWSPEKLLSHLKTVEARHGRQRTVDQWADRTLDIDIITYGAIALHTEVLTIPHPRAHERLFVLEPWLDLNGEAELPGHGPVAELVESLKRQSG